MTRSFDAFSERAKAAGHDPTVPLREPLSYALPGWFLRALGITFDYVVHSNAPLPLEPHIPARVRLVVDLAKEGATGTHLVLPRLGRRVMGADVAYAMTLPDMICVVPFDTTVPWWHRHVIRADVMGTSTRKIILAMTTPPAIKDPITRGGCVVLAKGAECCGALYRMHADNQMSLWRPV